MTALNTAFHSIEAWERFCSVADNPKFPTTADWIARMDEVVRRQASVRDQLPPHYSTTGAEVNLSTIRDAIQSRTVVPRNQARTNRLLGLLRHRLNGYDNVTAYHHILREQAELDAGHGEPQAQNRDPKGAPSLRDS
jgi:hypothetical protein